MATFTITPSDAEKAYLASCGCTQCGSAICGGCSATPFTFKVTLAGVTNGACTECSDWNRQYTLAFITTDPADPCVWTESFSLGCGITSATFSILGPFNVSFGIVGVTQRALWTAVTANCLGPNILTFITSSGDCANLPSTITVEPA